VLSIEESQRICGSLVGNRIGEEEKGSLMEEWWWCNASYE